MSDTPAAPKTRAAKKPRPMSSYSNKAIKAMKLSTAARLKAIEADIERRKSEFDADEATSAG